MSKAFNQTYRLTLADGTTHDLTIRHGDRMRAELEAGQRWPGLAGSMKDLPFHWMHLWVWAAATRTGIITDVGSRDFDPLDIDPLEDDTEPADAAEAAGLDPTPPGPRIT